MKTAKTLFGILTITVALAVQVQAQSFLTNGLVAYYPFNGGCNDASGNGNDGTNNGAQFGTDRLNQPNSAAYFNGSSWIGVPYNTNLSQQTFSISFWMKLNDLPTTVDGYEVALTENGDEPYTGLFFATFNYFEELGGPPMFGYCDVNGSDWSAQIGQPVTSWVTNQWYHLVAIRTTTNAQLFIDNYLSATASNITTIAPSTGPLVIGANYLNGSMSAYFRGAIDNIRIYNRALSSNEVAELYAYESVPQTPTAPTNGLVAYYPLNGNGKDWAGTNDMYFITIPPGLTTLASDTIYTNRGTFGTDRFGNPESAITFDDTNMSYARSANIIDASIVNNFTMTIWALAKSTNSLDWIGDGNVLLMPVHGSVNYGDGNAGVGIGMNYNSINIVGHSDNYGPLFLSASVASNVWHQIVVSCVNGVVGLYVDGKFIGESDQSSSGYTFHPSSGDPYAQDEFWIPLGSGIGGVVVYNNNDGYLDGYAGFNGNASDLRIYNRALSAYEVEQLYQYEATTPPTPPTPPAITNQPQSILVKAHDTATFNMTATGSGPLAYQWLHAGTNLPNATSSTLTIANARPFNIGAYRVVVTNNYGAVTSSVANLSLNPNYAGVSGPYLGVSVTISNSLQNVSKYTNGITTTANPTTSRLVATNILTLLAFDERAAGNWPSNGFPRSSTLALASGRFVVVNGTNFLLDVSDIMTFTNYLPQIHYGKLNNSNGLASPSLTTVQMAALAFDDTFISGGKNYQFYLAGVLTQTKTDTTPLNKKYTETITQSLGSGAGDGSILGVPFICTGTFSATASSSIKLNP